jgi:hypothetical protein
MPLDWNNRIFYRLSSLTTTTSPSKNEKVKKRERETVFGWLSEIILPSLFHLPPLPKQEGKTHVCDFGRD